ncbi:MAG: hypothetical protein GX307_04550 [Euryarchaeota archaeon]|nr:hypothetical protein [Euryarchaeota archaeon]
MNTRTFDLICIAVIIITGVVAISVVQTSPHGKSLDIPGLDTNGEGLSTIQPLGLTLSLVILPDFGLMVAALVLVFKDESEPRPPT